MKGSHGAPASLPVPLESGGVGGALEESVRSTSCWLLSLGCAPPSSLLRRKTFRKDLSSKNSSLSVLVSSSRLVDSENARGVTEWVAMSAHPIINSSRMFFPAPRIRHAAFLDRQKKNYRLRRAGLIEVGFLPPSASPTDAHPEIVAHIHPSVLPKLDDKN